ncbi:MAG: hypothetical protein CVT92_08840 [Bacteroidetes bacterium HGW-Bacteroidetes-1]|jgi:PKD repeat protein|nr:MAG: hypothetical protein CVT92_08840 [Bacteroidetes bacterium HGW-Bacteroidetes-1]
MKNLRLFFSIFLSILLFSAAAQDPKNNSYRGSAEAFSKVNFRDIVEYEKRAGDVESQQFKRPNPEIYKPLFEVKPETVLFIETDQPPQNKTSVMKEISPMPDTTFMGLYDSGNSIPPDVNGAPGPDHLMVTLNTQVRVQHRDGTDISTVTLGGFWMSLPGSGTFDPKILYDFEEDRWVFVTCAGSTPGDSRIYMGVSADSDPTGTWYLYSYIADAQNVVWFDYPSIGFNKNWIVVSGNMFGGGFYSTVYVFDKHAMYQGLDTPQFTRFATNQGFTLVPAITYDANEENVYLISSADGNQNGSGYISLFKVEGAVDNPQFGLVGNIGTPNPWAGYVNGSGDFLPQLGSDQLINAVDHRMENVIFRNNKLWATHHVFLPANNPQRTSVQWWNITPTGELIQRGRVDDPDGVFSFAFPTLAVNAFEDMLIGHNIFSFNQYASAGYSYKAHFDPLNTTRSPYQYKDGLAPYYKTFGGGRNRWGDYSATMLDPLNSVDFWILQEYAELPSGGDRWGTWWAYLRIPFEPQPDFTANETLIPLGESIQFTDKSAGVPQTWNWSFEGGQPATSDLQNPDNITFTTEGSFAVSLSVSNDFGSNAITKTDYITVSSTLLPEIIFEVDKQLVCTGEIVTFTDQSLYMPREWEWVFTPSTVTFMNGTNAYSQHPQVVFDAPGDYSVTLTATNLNGSSVLTKFDQIRAGGLDVPFFELFQTASFEEAFWIVENPDNQKTWEMTEVEGLAETSKAAKLDFLNYYAIGQRDRLISPPLNLSNYSQMNLSFKHAYAQRLTQITDSLIVYITDDCGQSWTRIFADAENGTGNFATHPMAQGFVPQVPSDWCGSGFGSGCINLDISNWAGKADVMVAFETYSAYGNPIFVTSVEIAPAVGLPALTALDANLRVYPNPGKGVFKIEHNQGKILKDIRIYNLAGRQILSKELLQSGGEIEVSNLASGVYFLRTMVNGSVEWCKIMIE